MEKKILIIQQKMVGDVLVSTILCEHLKLKFPKSKVHFLINTPTEAVVLGNPFVDQIVYFEDRFRKSKPEFFRFLQAIRKERYDVVIDVYCKLESNLISLFSRAPIKISYNKWYSKFIYGHTFELSQNENTKLGLAIENRLLLLSPLIQGCKLPDLGPKIYLAQNEVDKSRDFLIQNQINLTKPLIMVGILGSSAVKSYPLKFLARVLDWITLKMDCTLLFNYLPSQRNQVKELLFLCSEESKSKIREDVFCNSLRSFLGVLSICDAYIGNEGGASNMSKALGVPNFSIFSPWISKKAWLTFVANTANRAVHLEDFKPDLIEGRSKKERKTNALKLYEAFVPELFKADLECFIQEEVLSHQ